MKLTDKEARVTMLTGQGYTAPEIGRRMRRSPKTIDTFKRRVATKWGLTMSQYRKAAFKYAVRGLMAEAGLL